MEEYKAALPVYEDFHQKRQLQKLRKLLQDKAALPIAAFGAQIVEAVRANSAVVVAGDTGPKSSSTLPLARKTSELCYGMEGPLYQVRLNE